MKFTTQAVVVGAKAFRDTVEGKPYDSTTLFVQMELDERNGNAKGYAVNEMKWGVSDNFHAIKHNEFPIQCELEIELVTSGKAQKQVVVACKPIARVVPAPVNKAGV